MKQLMDERLEVKSAGLVCDILEVYTNEQNVPQTYGPLDNQGEISGLSLWQPASANEYMAQRILYGWLAW